MELNKYNLQSQEQLLVSLYLKCMNKAEAARDAGYASTTVFRKAEVKAAIADQLAIRAERLRIGADWVLAEAVKVYERCMQVEKIVDNDSGQVKELKFDANNALKALALIGKHVDIKAFDEKAVHVDVDKEIAARLNAGRLRVNSHRQDLLTVEPSAEEVSFL